MLKKLGIASLLMLILVISMVSCAPKSEPPAKISPAAPIAQKVQETQVNEVAKGISDAGNTDKDLDSSELNAIDSIISDIEKI